MGDSPHLSLGHADHGDVGDRRVAHQHVLHLGGIDVLAPGHDHVLDPVVDVEVAVGVEVADVAGTEPPVLVDRLARRLRVVPVALHHLLAAHEDLPRDFGFDDVGTGHHVDDAQLDAGSGQATRTEAVRSRPVEVVVGGGRWVIAPVVSVSP